MAKLYQITLRWVKTTMNPEIIDRALNPMGDWLRYNGTSWLFFTDQSATYVREVLKKTLATEDSIMIVRVDPTDFDGWAPEWIWSWIRDRAKKITR